VPELGFMRLRFTTPDDLRVRFPQTGYFFLRRNCFALQHAPRRLIDHALDQRSQLVELQDETFSDQIAFLLAQLLCGLTGLVQRAVIWHSLIVDPHPATIAGAVTHFLFDLPIRPLFPTAQYHQAQRDLHGWRPRFERS